MMTVYTVIPARPGAARSTFTDRADAELAFEAEAHAIFAVQTGEFVTRKRDGALVPKPGCVVRNQQHRIK